MMTSGLLSLRKFVAPEFIFGAGAYNLAGRYARNFGAKKVLVVTDKGVMDAGWTARVLESLKNEKVRYVVYSGVSSNPRAEEVMEGVEAYMANQCNVIIAVGGGSVIDTAKGIGIVSTNKRHILEFEGVDKVLSPMPPLICIPTTGGTSADVSQFAIFLEPEEKRKIAVISKAVVPDISLISPETLTTMDPYLTATTGIDAIVHSIEAFVSNASSHFTDMHALAAIRLIYDNLLKSIRYPDNLEFRANVMMGSLEAGLAFSNASLGLVHASAHSLGGMTDLPHGECNALMLSPVLRFNFEVAPEKFIKLGETLNLDMRGMNSNQKRDCIIGRIEELKKNSGIITTLSQKGIKSTDFKILSKNALKDPCAVTNPRKPKLKDIEVIYAEAL